MFSLTSLDTSDPRETVQDLFFRAVRGHGEKKLLISDADGSVFTYADAGKVVLRIMAKLDAEGITKGDMICTSTASRAEVFFLFWAAASLGAVFVPLDPAMPEGTLERILEQVKPKLFFCERKGSGGRSMVRDRITTILFDDPGDGAPGDAPGFSSWCGTAAGTVSAPVLRLQDDAAILYTSGSTGYPKGVILSHRAVYGRGWLMQDLNDWTENDLYLSGADIHVVTGLLAAIAPLHAGCSFLVTPPARRANAVAVAECIKQYRCTQFFTVPIALSQFMQFKDSIPPANLDTLRSIVSGGVALQQELADAFYKHYGIPVLNCHGMTEVGYGAAHSLESFSKANGSIGLPVGIVEIIDADGNALKDGVVGEMRIKSDYAMSGYYQNPELTGKVLRDGWVYTGDLAMRRPDGHLVLMGRSKNIIKHANGELISFEEVEAALERHPEVREAAVCGFLSAQGHERLAAFVVPEHQPERPADLFKSLQRTLKDELGSFKVPAVFYLRDRLPRNNMGKVPREELKKEIRES